jgi:hypothetical protein
MSLLTQRTKKNEKKCSSLTVDNGLRFKTMVHKDNQIALRLLQNLTRFDQLD